MLRYPDGLFRGLKTAPTSAPPAPLAATAITASRPSTQGGSHPLGWIAGAFLLVQAGICWWAPNGPFVDEALYTVAGLRALEGRALSDGYMSWFNGSVFIWPVIAGVGHQLAGLVGARLMAAVLSTVTLVAVGAAAGRLFGSGVSVWCALALALNGLFLALGHFAVYDVAALTCLALSLWCGSHWKDSADRAWVLAAAAAFAMAVIAKYGYLALLPPLVGLLVSARGLSAAARPVVLFLVVVASLVGAYFLACFGTLFPPSSGAYLEQSFGRSRGHIAALQIVFGIVPLGLAIAGAVVAWRRHGSRGFVVTCLLALFIYPAFHLWTANFVSGQKHVVAGFLFAYLLAGVALERLWKSGSRARVALVLGFLTVWGAAQCYAQDRSWADTRPLAEYLVTHVRSGDRVLAESPWTYTLPLYSAGRVSSPASVIDANHSPERHRLDVCQIPWAVGDVDSAPFVRYVVERCGHAPALSLGTRKYYIDTARLRLTVSSSVVSVYRLPRP